MRLHAFAQIKRVLPIKTQMSKDTQFPIALTNGGVSHNDALHQLLVRLFVVHFRLQLTRYDEWCSMATLTMTASPLHAVTLRKTLTGKLSDKDLRRANQGIVTSGKAR